LVGVTSLLLGVMRCDIDRLGGGEVGRRGVVFGRVGWGAFRMWVCIFRGILLMRILTRSLGLSRRWGRRIW
jgi:hypothetical protein